MVNEFWKRHRRFCDYVENKGNNEAKEPDTTNINRKQTAQNRKIALPLNSLFLLL